MHLALGSCRSCCSTADDDAGGPNQKITNKPKMPPTDGWSEDAIEADVLGFELPTKQAPSEVVVIKAEDTSKETKTPDAHVLYYSEWFGDAPHGLAGKIPEPKTPTPNPTREWVVSPARGNGQISMDIPKGQGLPDVSPHTQDELHQMEARPRQEMVEYGGMAHSWYTGQWLDEERHGRGKVERPDGSIFEGFFVHGRAHGPGIFRMTDGSVYWGQWRDGHSHGFGRCVNKGDHSTYTGEWRHNEKCGRGVEVWQDGTEYDGAFRHGFKHGHGHYRANRVKGALEYVGQFKDDRMDGHGSYSFPDGRKYAGKWDHGHIHGAGKMEWPNGCHYDGHYERDLKHGFGHFVWTDGRAYRGQWFNGVQHGEGVRISKDGVQSKSHWRHGKLVVKSDGEAVTETPPSTPPNSNPPTPSGAGGPSAVHQHSHEIEVPKRSSSFLPVISNKEQDHIDRETRSNSSRLIRERSARLDAEHRNRELPQEGSPGAIAERRDASARGAAS